VHQAGRKPEPGRRRLEGGEQLPMHGDAVRQANKALGRAVNLQQAGCQSSKSGRASGKASPLRLKGTFRLHRDPPSRLDRDGQAPSLAKTVCFHLHMERLGTRLEMFEVSNVVRKDRHEFHKSPPCKAGFCISGDLLGGLPPSLDQFHQHLAAATQAAALLELVDCLDHFLRQIHDKLPVPFRRQAASIGAVFIGGISVCHSDSQAGESLASIPEIKRLSIDSVT
jgi:hypothetical protein